MTTYSSFKHYHNVQYASIVCIYYVVIHISRDGFSFVQWFETIGLFEYHVQQDLLTHPEHINSSAIVNSFCAAQSLVFFIVFFSAIVGLFVTFLLTIALSVLFLFTASH